MRTGARAYLATQVTTTTQGDLLLMLYDAAIKFLKQAKVKIVERNYAQKGILISRALDIVSELAESLNKDKGGDLARNLHNLYFYCSARLAKANLKMDTALVDEVIGILNGLRSAFAQIIPGQEGRPSSALHGATEQAEPEPMPRPQLQPPPVSRLDLMGNPAKPLPDLLPQAANAPAAQSPATSPQPAQLKPAESLQAGAQAGGNAARLRAAAAYSANRR
ncbi:MAG TPA: flagellar export chaperone FliS [Desulfovibrio sp.]|nr:flagellar export chaperone FliS [Desulfovibrio sp.]